MTLALTRRLKCRLTPKVAKERTARWQKNTAESGRSHLATADKVFDRIRGLKVPRTSDKTPVFITEDIPKDVFFPVAENELSAAFQKLGADTQGVTHVLLRRAKSSEFRSGRIPFAEYIFAEGICLIAFYPWPRGMVLPLGKKPADNVLNRYKRWGVELTSHKGKWQLIWKSEQLADFYLEELLKHEVEVHTDFQKRILPRALARGRDVMELRYSNQRFFEESQVIW